MQHNSNSQLKEPGNQMADGRSATVFVVDSDPDAVKFTTDLVREHRMGIEQFGSAEDFWSILDDDTSGCVVLELDLPGMTGIQLQERMCAAGFSLPVIVTASTADAAVAVRAMKLGAADFLQKPIHPRELWEAIQAALEVDRAQRRHKAIRRQIRGRLEALTSQEQTVLQMVLAGTPNAVIARTLDLSLRSIDFRRASILRKTQARSLPELARIVALADETIDSIGHRVSYSIVKVVNGKSAR